MQKSRNATIFLIVGILCFGLLGSIYLVKSYNITYTYIINPLVWILFAVFLHFILGKNMENKKLRKQIIQYSLVAAITFILTYMISGLVVTFGKNPYDTTLKGFIYNFLAIGIVLIAKEYIRYKLINNVYDKHKTEIAILIGIVYVIIDFEFTKFIGRNFSVLWLARYIVQYVAPNIAKNIVFSYTVIYSDYLPGMIYQLLTNLYFWVSPIIPNAPWVMVSIIEITIPIILFLYIRFIKNKLNIYKSKEDIINSDPRNIIPLVIMIILAIWFAVRNIPN